MTYPVIEAIEALSRALRDTTDLKEAEAWWSLYLKIESEVEPHARTTSAEQELLRSLSAGVSEAIRSVREKWPSTSLHRARVALSALRSSIERRTIGADGWPMRR